MSFYGASQVAKIVDNASQTESAACLAVSTEMILTALILAVRHHAHHACDSSIADRPAEGRCHYIV